MFRNVLSLIFNLSLHAIIKVITIKTYTHTHTHVEVAQLLMNIQ